MNAPIGSVEYYALTALAAFIGGLSGFIGVSTFIIIYEYFYPDKDEN